MEALVTTLFVGFGFGELAQLLAATIGCINGRDEVEIAMVGGCELLLQWRQAIDTFSHLGPLDGGRPIAMMNLASLLEEGDISHSGFDAEDDAELVIHLNRNWSHPMANPCAFNPCLQVVTHFILIVAMQLAPEKGA